MSFILESPFRKGGISPNSQFLIIGLILGLTFIYSIDKQNKDFSKILKFIKLSAILLSTAIGLIFSMIISKNYLNNIYGLDFRLYLNETFSNFSFITVSFLTSALLIEILNKILKNYNYS